MTRLALRSLCCLFVFLALGVLHMSRADEKSAAEKSAAAGKCFEMRTYIANPGKMEALHKRFREHTNQLFVKHGMTLVGYWTPSEGDGKDNTLVYILSYPSREAREKSWKAFQDDPVWKAAKAESEKDGVLVKGVEIKFLTATDYSPIK